MELAFSFVYPSPDGPVPSVGWEGVREGVDDYKYLDTLSQVINQARAAGHEEAAQKAARTLQEITDQVRVEAYQAAIKAGEATGWRLGTHFHRPSPQAEIAPGDYHKFRSQIAQEVMNLMGEMNEGSS
jgi:hypothetical protein